MTKVLTRCGMFYFVSVSYVGAYVPAAGIVEVRHVGDVLDVVVPENEFLRIETVGDQVKKAWDESDEQNFQKMTANTSQLSRGPKFVHTKLLPESLPVDL